MSLDSSLAVARLVGFLGKIEGRKRLQKLVHLLTSKDYPEFDQEFSLHFFGPFSRQLAAQIDFLWQMKLIDECFDEGRRLYSYVPICVEHEGETIPALDALDAQADEHEERKWGSVAETLNKEKTPFLEALSTVVYLDDIGRKGDVLEKEFTRIKPDLAFRFPEVKKYATEHGWI